MKVIAEAKMHRKNSVLEITIHRKLQNSQKIAYLEQTKRKAKRNLDCC